MTISADSLRGFIEAMRAEYPASVPQSNGQRFTGFGSDNRLQPGRVAGVVHEGEQVVEADMVKRAGGPERIRDTVEDLAKRPLPGFQEGTGDDVVPSPFVRAGQTIQRHVTDTANKVTSAIPSVAPAAPGEIKETTVTPGIQRADPLTKTVSPAIQTVTPAAPGEIRGATIVPEAETIQPVTAAPPGEIKTAKLEPVDPSKTPELQEPSIYQRAAETGLAGLEKIAAGESEARRLAEEQAREQLAGTQAADVLSTRMQLAQQGVEGGEANAAIAMQKIAQGTQTAAMETDLAIAAATQAENALMQMINVGFEGQRLDLAKDQFGLDEARFNELKNQFSKTFGLDLDRFVEDVRRYGIEDAWRRHTFGVDNNWKAAQVALETGDVQGLTNAMNKIGISGVDFTRLENKFAQTEVGNGLANLEADINSNRNMSTEELLNLPTVQADLERIWTNTSDTPVDSDEFRTWARNTVENQKIVNDPIFGPVAGLDMNDMASALGVDLNTYSFNGITGADGLRLSLANTFQLGGLNVNENGSLSFKPDVIFDNLGPGDTGATPANLTAEGPVDAEGNVTTIDLTVDPATLSLEQWKLLGTEELDKMVSANDDVQRVSVSDLKSLSSAEKVQDSGLKFDVAYNLDSGKTLMAEAGEGNGSIVVFDDEPYQLTHYFISDDGQFQIYGKNLATGEVKKLKTK